MKRTYMDSLDYTTALLSVFDISGSLQVRNISWPSNGIQQDMSQLVKDQRILEEDYRSACEKIAKNQKNRQ
jgi:hypothetical protein